MLALGSASGSITFGSGCSMLYRKISWLVFTFIIASPLFGQIDFGAVNSSNSAPALGIMGRSHAASVSGMVQGLDGAPVKDVRVEAVNRATGQSMASAFTDASGTFHLNEVPSGGYDIVAQSGVNEAREQIVVDELESYVSLRLVSNGADRTAGNANSVSVRQMKVPENARKLFQKAQELVRKNKTDEGKKVLAQALQQYPQYAEATTLEAILKMGENQTPNAIDELQTAIQYDPSYALAYIALGSCLNSQSRWDDAIRSLDEGLRLDPRSWQAYFEMGKALTAKADYSKALAQLSKAESIAPKYAPIHLVRAYALLGMSKYIEAIPELEVYVQSDPNAPTVSKARQTLDKIRALAANSSAVASNALR